MDEKNFIIAFHEMHSTMTPSEIARQYVKLNKEMNYTFPDRTPNSINACYRRLVKSGFKPKVDETSMQLVLQELLIV